LWTYGQTFLPGLLGHLLGDDLKRGEESDGRERELGKGGKWEKKEEHCSIPYTLKSLYATVVL